MRAGESSSPNNNNQGAKPTKAKEQIGFASIAKEPLEAPTSKIYPNQEEHQDWLASLQKTGHQLAEADL